MTTQRLHVPAGKLFCLSHGEHSDYSYQGHFLALTGITPEMFREVEEECKAAQKVKNISDGAFYSDTYDADDKFIPALIRRGWVMEVDCVEIHTGSSYGELYLS